MRSLIFSTEEISFTTGEPSDRPKGLRPRPSDADSVIYRDITVAFLCVEADDSSRDIDCMVAELEKYYHQVKRKILIVPFAHLSSHTVLEDQDQLGRCLKAVEDRLSGLGILAARIGEGYHRALHAKGIVIDDWITKEHKCSVAFRDSRFHSQSPQISTTEETECAR